MAQIYNDDCCAVLPCSVTDVCLGESALQLQTLTGVMFGRLSDLHRHPWSSDWLPGVGPHKPATHHIPGDGRGWSYAGHGLWATDQNHPGTDQGRTAFLLFCCWCPRMLQGVCSHVIHEFSPYHSCLWSEVDIRSVVAYHPKKIQHICCWCTTVLVTSVMFRDVLLKTMLNDAPIWTCVAMLWNWTHPLQREDYHFVSPSPAHPPSSGSHCGWTLMLLVLSLVVFGQVLPVCSRL